LRLSLLCTGGHLGVTSGSLVHTPRFSTR